MSEFKRLHPVAIIINALKVLKETLIPILILILLPGNGGDGWGYNDLIFAGFYFVVSIISGAITWFKFTYQITPEEIRIHQGFFVKKKRYIRIERIQSIDITEGIIQRLFSLVQVNIETAGSSSGKAEGVLTAIKKEDADVFQTLLKDAKQLQSFDNTSEGLLNEEKTLFQMPFSQLFLMGATSGGIGIVFSGALVLFSQFTEVIRFDRFFNEVEKLITVGIYMFILVVFLALLLAYIISTILVFLKYANFTVKKSEDELIITRGLLEKRRLTIPIAKIQAVRVVENIIRQPFGFATVYVETASGSIGNNENSKVMLFPIIKKQKIKQLIEPFKMDYVFDVPITHVPQRALKRYVFRQWIWLIPAIVIIVYFFRPYGYLALLLFPIFTFYAYLSFRTAGWNISGRQLTLTFQEFFSKNTYIVQKNKVQSMTTRQSIFQKKVQLGTITANSLTGLGASSGDVIDVDEKDVTIMKNWYKHGVKYSNQ